MSAIFVLKNKPSVLYTDYFFYGLLGISILFLSIIVFSFLFNDFVLPSYTSFLGGLAGGGAAAYMIMIRRKPLRGKKEIAELSVFENRIEFKIVFNRTYSNKTHSFEELKSARLDDTFFTITLQNEDTLIYFAANLNFKERKLLQDLASKINKG